MKIDAAGMHYRELNERIRAAAAGGEARVEIAGACGQRYIGTGLTADFRIEIRGTPGNDLAAFMNGPRITVRGSGQDAVGNTMSGGEVLIHGHAGDLLAHSMRGGTMMVRDSAGYRVGIHMKSFGERCPVVVVGGKVGDYAGEYMAGGMLVVLGLTSEDGAPIAGRYLGTGMHGGEIFVRGEVEVHQLGKEVGRADIDEATWERLSAVLGRFSEEFGVEAAAKLERADFIRLVPTTHRPYGTLYVY
ncbi:MAG: GltB/FmdC/FwdC-like GXGXG domain-containing protein [Planctomycetota bacterium]|jgi:glutamate synthase domain-containing protein 3